MPLLTCCHNKLSCSCGVQAKEFIFEHTHKTDIMYVHVFYSTVQLMVSHTMQSKVALGKMSTLLI